MMHLVIQFLLAMFATAGFSVIIRVPVRHIPVCMIIGALGWAAYETSMYYYSYSALGCFIGACVVGLLSNIAAHFLKDAATIFVIPGILCLVPGGKIYSTMYAVLQNDFTHAAEVGTETMLMAGSIALGLLTVGVILRVIYAVARKTVTLRDKF